MWTIIPETLCFHIKIISKIAALIINVINFISLLLHRACYYICFIQTNSCTLFKTHSHSHSHLILQIIKNVCKIHQLKPYIFRSQLFDHLQGVVFRAECCYYFLCLFASSIWYVAVMLSVCVRA
jgi:hypothetical protein